MTSKFSYASDGIEYCRTSRSVPLSSSRLGEPARSYPIGSRVNPHIAAGDLDDKEKQRKRIAVACSRCRKRKIKCSGDPGNGQGCLNCKNAGTDPQLCQFLRVSSVNTDCGYFTAGSEWPYFIGMNGPPSVNPGSLGGISPYQPIENGLPTSAQGRLVRTQFGNPWPYPGGSSSDCYGYNAAGEGAFGQYGLHATNQISGVPNESADPTNIYGSQEHLRQWAPAVPQSGRSASNAFENSSNTKLPHALPLLGSTSTSGEAHHTFPGMGALASSLPASAMNDRLLPNPRSNATASSVSETPLSASQVFNPEGSVPLKSEPAWFERTDGLSAPPVGGSGASASNQLLTAPSEAQKLAFSYPRLRTQTTSQELSSAPEFAMGTATTAASTLDEQMLPTSSFGTNSYTYSLPSDSKQPSVSQSTLLNGQSYSPLPSHQYQHSQTTFELPRKEHANSKRSLLTTAARTYT